MTNCGDWFRAATNRRPLIYCTAPLQWSSSNCSAFIARLWLNCARAIFKEHFRVCDIDVTSDSENSCSAGGQWSAVLNTAELLLLLLMPKIASAALLNTE